MGDVSFDSTSNVSLYNEAGLEIGSVVSNAVTRDIGTWAYRAGDFGSVTIPAGGRVLSICAYAATAASFSINGGDSIPVPANVGAAVCPKGNLTAPTIVFTGTNSWFVEYVS